MNAEIFAALAQLEKERGIPQSYMVEKITQALVAAYKKDKDGKVLEPMELLMIEVPDNYVGAVMEKIGSRKAELLNMGSRESGTTHMEFKIPARGLMGYRSEFLTDTNGNGIMNQLFAGYEPYKGEIQTRERGSIIVHEAGETTGYGLFNTQERGRLFVGPGVPVYEGMIVGANPKNEDITVNVCKKKHATTIGDGAFIGSDTMMVAPVNIGAGAIIGASSCITRDVAPDALALERADQREIEGWAAKHMAKLKAKKEAAK